MQNLQILKIKSRIRTKSGAVKFLAALLFVIALVLFSCRSTAGFDARTESPAFSEQIPVSEKIPIEEQIARTIESFNPAWLPVQDGIVWKASCFSERLIFHLVKIRLSSEDSAFRLAVSALPDSPKIKSYGIQRLSQKRNFLVCVNTTPFSAKGILRTGKKSPVGLTISNGALISEPVARYGAIAFFERADGLCARIYKSQTDSMPDCTIAGSGGFWQILEAGKIIQFKEIRDSRTALALTPDGKTLFILAVEGEHKSKSTGLTYMECAKILQKLGCSDAIEMDGGSSTALTVNGKSQLTYTNFTKSPCFLGFSLFD